MFPSDFFQGLLGTTVYCLYGFILLVIAFKIIDKITPGDLGKELIGDNKEGTPNLALGIFSGLMFLGICLIVAASIH
jgi:uncharacterized membrane protein YjfL (UPF0719 family)